MDPTAEFTQLQRHVVDHTQWRYEVIRPLEFSPAPVTPLRKYLADDVVAADLDRLAAGQREDGGWDIDFRAYSPAAALEWRGYATVDAVAVLRAHGGL